MQLQQRVKIWIKSGSSGSGSRLAPSLQTNKSQQKGVGSFFH
jgi:hypothetical protein